MAYSLKNLTCAGIEKPCRSCSSDETRKGRANQTEYRIQKGEKFDELDKSIIMKKKMEEYAEKHDIL